MQIIKSILKKPDCEGRDPYVTLLKYGNTQLAGHSRQLKN